MKHEVTVNPFTREWQIELSNGSILVCTDKSTLEAMLDELEMLPRAISGLSDDGGMILSNGD
jgi:hypothetical protein